MPESLVRPTFLNCTPVPLAFGTSGLRGLVKDITDLEAYINIKAALRYLLSIGEIDAGGGVVIAGDLRPSTDRIMRACAQAIVDSGCRVENAGKIPTPALISHAISAGRAGVMVTGSHIPFDRNGIKINKSVGEVLKSDEPGITREVEHVRVQEYSRTATESAFDGSGMLKRSPELHALARAAEEAYIRRYLTSFTCGGLSGLRVLVYQHSAVGRDILPRILREFGAEVITAGRSETFVSIDTENITDEQLDRLEEFAVAAEASGRPLHAIVSTDGDSDRPLLTAALPTRDSTLPILANLFAAAEQRIGFPTLWNRLPVRSGRAGLIDNVPVAVSQAILANLIAPGAVIEVEFDGAGGVLDRSRPDAMPTLLAEPATADWQQRKAPLARFLPPRLRFADIVRINVLDGVRVYFHDSDVAHVRPSGNAPQLRIYANSDSQARADEIVELGLREPDGILRQLERAFT